MKIKLFSIIASLLFFPLSVIGNLLGGLFVEIQTWLSHVFFSPHSPYYIPDEWKYPFGQIVAGILGGIIAAVIIKRIYKKVDVLYAIIFPALLMTYAFYIDLTNAINNSGNWAPIGNCVRHICTISSYYIYLKKK